MIERSECCDTDTTSSSVKRKDGQSIVIYVTICIYLLKNQINYQYSPGNKVFSPTYCFQEGIDIVLSKMCRMQA